MTLTVLVVVASGVLGFGASLGVIAVLVLRELLPTIRSWRRRRVLRQYAAEQTKQSPVLSWHA